MITQASHIGKGTDWDGYDSRQHSTKLESKMNFAEHQRIAFKARKLLAGEIDVPDNAAGEKLRALKEAYEGGSSSDVLYITKGIHQPNSNPHMQLTLERGGTKKYVYHLNVSVSNRDIPGLPEEYFHWVGVQFAAEQGADTAFWPKVATWDNKWQNRRRLSIAPKDVREKIVEIEEKKQAAILDEQARVSQSERAKTRLKIEELLKTQNWTIPTNKNQKLNELIDKKTIEVTTRTKSKIRISYNGKSLVQEKTA